MHLTCSTLIKYVCSGTELLLVVFVGNCMLLNTPDAFVFLGVFDMDVVNACIVERFSVNFIAVHLINEYNVVNNTFSNLSNSEPHPCTEIEVMSLA